MLFVVPVVLFDMLKAKQLACVSESGQKCPAARSLSLRRAWIEISTSSCGPDRGSSGRSPYGERGLKYPNDVPPARMWKSLSLRRAWIEILRTLARPPTPPSRSPYGERGLKFNISLSFLVERWSLSLRRAWIDILPRRRSRWRPPGRSPYGERGLK